MPSVFNDPPFSDDDYAMKLLLHKPRFQKGVISLRQKWHIPKAGFPNQEARDNWGRQLAKNTPSRFTQDISSFLQVFKLTERHHRAVSEYIQTNAPYSLRSRAHDPLRIDYYIGDGVERNIRSISIEVDKDTTQREVIEAFKDAQALLNIEKTKKQKPEKLDRDLKVLELHNDGMKVTKIAEWLNETQSKNNEAFNADDVHTILKRTKKKLR